jgi:predicted transcriptional regulator
MSDRTAKKTANLSLRVDADLKARLEELAARDRRTLSTYIEMALERTVDAVAPKRAA